MLNSELSIMLLLIMILVAIFTNSGIALFDVSGYISSYSGVLM